MTRKDFIKNLATFGIATPFMTSLLSSCNKENVQFFDELTTNFDGKIIIVGAGSAGLIAGHILQQQGIDFQIIEASSIFGGRVKKAANFVDFPIDLGAEWIHTDPSILAKLLNDPSVKADIELVPYSPETHSIWKNGKMKKRNIFSHFYSEYKFKNTTWFDFFDQYIVPNIADKIVYNSPVTEIDYSQTKVRLKNEQGKMFTADKVLVTVPLTILQKNYINFQPTLPTEKIRAINEVDVPEGIKVFIEFSERFYPDMLHIGGLTEVLTNESERIFYDAAFRKDTNTHVLALFNVGSSAADYTDLGSDDAILNKIMGELDEMFAGQASKFYKQHIIQNWSKEPFIQGSYTHYENSNYGNMEIISAPLDNKVFFAGEALHDEANATVHGAGESGYNAISNMIAS